jgi:hypothetical protein
MKISEPLELDVVKCATCADAHKVKAWLKEQLPDKDFYVVCITAANCWLIVALQQVGMEASFDVSANPQAQ